jgi:hypothetical protein
VVSAMDPQGRILGFLDWNHYYSVVRNELNTREITHACLHNNKELIN